MTLGGTVVNGVVVLDGKPDLPEGARVRVELADADDDWGDYAPPPPTETREEYLASLRESITNVHDGQGRPVDEVFAEIEAELRRAETERGT